MKERGRRERREGKGEEERRGREERKRRGEREKHCLSAGILLKELI